jgi:imidazolonepropionase-like amidohydrolase
VADLAITGVRVWDGEAQERSSAPLTIRVEGQRIAAIGAAPELQAGAEVLSFEGATALPGLTDAHVHFSIDPQIHAQADQGKVPFEQRERDMEARALAMVRAGITTARDLGGGSWRELALRDRIAAGDIPGPRVVCAGQPLTSARGHCWFWGGEATGGEEIRAVISRQVERAADWIKVMATGGVTTKGTSPGTPQFETAELAFAVAEAGLHGRPVAAHCHGTEGIRRAAEAGVRTIEHCSFVGGEGFGSGLDREVVKSIAARGAWVSPTVNAGWKRFLDPEGKQAAFGTRMSEVLQGLRSEGVRLIASTDAGIPRVEHHHLPEALAVFAALAKLSNVDALRSATSESARALGMEDVTGALRPGLEADVLVVDGDPLSDLAVLQKPLLVLARGSRVEPAH